VSRTPTSPPWEAPTTLTPAPVDPPVAEGAAPVAEAWELPAEAPRLPLDEAATEREEPAAAEVVATAKPSEEEKKG